MIVYSTPVKPIPANSRQAKSITVNSSIFQPSPPQKKIQCLVQEKVIQKPFPAVWDGNKKSKETFLFVWNNYPCIPVEK